jgi:hypothetical protein
MLVDGLGLAKYRPAIESGGWLRSVFVQKLSHVTRVEASSCSGNSILSTSS